MAPLLVPSGPGPVPGIEIGKGPRRGLAIPGLRRETYFFGVVLVYHIGGHVHGIVRKLQVEWFVPVVSGDVCTSLVREHLRRKGIFQRHFFTIVALQGSDAKNA